MGRPSAPVSYEDMLADQANRLANNNYGAGFGGWSPTAGSYSGETSYDYEGEKGNPFFTEENQIPLSTYSGTSSNRAPFLWNGNNNSLRNVVKQAYDSYYAGVPQTTSSVQQQTWGGPEIRALYGEQDAGFGYDPTELMDVGSMQQTAPMQSTGLSNIGTPQYWQDNNKNKSFDSEYDDFLYGIGGEPQGMF